MNGKKIYLLHARKWLEGKGRTYAEGTPTRQIVADYKVEFPDKNLSDGKVCMLREDLGWARSPRVHLRDGSMKGQVRTKDKRLEVLIGMVCKLYQGLGLELPPGLEVK